MGKAEDTRIVFHTVRPLCEMIAIVGSCIQRHIVTYRLRIDNISVCSTYGYCIWQRCIFDLVFKFPTQHLFESCHFSARHIYSSQTAAIHESTISNACDAIGNRHRGQTAAIIESLLSNACDAIGNRHRGQTAAKRESSHSNACDAIGNSHRAQTAAIHESTISNACDTIGDRHRGQTAAISERITSNACDAIGNRHRCQTSAIIESIISNACDAIGSATIRHRFRDNNSSRIIPSPNYSCCCSIQLVSNSVNGDRRKRWRVKNCHRHCGNEQRKKFVFHIILC